MGRKLSLLAFTGLTIGCAHARVPQEVAWDRKYVGDGRGIAEQNGVLRFTLDPRSTQINGGWRVELTDPKKFHNGDTVEFEVISRITQPRRAGEPESLSLYQWHEQLPGRTSKRPPLIVKLRGDEIVVTAWNDQILAMYPGNGPGPALFRIPIERGAWYRLRGLIKFDPLGGHLRVEVSRATTLDSPFSAAQIFFDGPIGIGYAQALSYYFKVGAYTTLPFTVPMQVEHVMTPQKVRPVSDPWPLELKVNKRKRLAAGAEEER